MPKIGANFTFESTQPNFARDSYETLAAMKAVVTIDDGHIAYCAEDEKTYKYLSSNTSDATTGRWREFGAGSGSSTTISTSITVTDEVKENDTNPVSSGAVYKALQDDELVTVKSIMDLNDRLTTLEAGGTNVTVDTEVKKGGQNPVSGNAIYEALETLNTRIASIKNDGVSITVSTELKTDDANPVAGGTLYKVITENEEVVAGSLASMSTRINDLETTLNDIASGGTGTISAVLTVDGKIEKDNIHAVSGGTVYDALTNACGVDTTNSLIKVSDGNGGYYVVAAQKLETPATPAQQSLSGTNTSESRTLILACTTSGASIYYTTDGTDPTSNSNKYSSSITLTANTANKTTNTTVKAIAIKNGISSEIFSVVVTTARTVKQPSITASGNEYAASRSITLSCATTSVAIYYTTNGDTPSTTSSSLYSASFNITNTCTVKALATKTDWQSSSSSVAVTVGTKKMWWGLTTSAIDSDSAVESLGHSIEKKTLPTDGEEITMPASNTAGNYLVFCIPTVDGINAISMVLSGFTYEQDAIGTAGSYKVFKTKSALGNVDGATWTITKQ